MYIRTIRFKTTFDCCYEGVPQLGKYERKAVHQLEYIEEFLAKPTVGLEVWADKTMKKVSKPNMKISCEELSKSMYPCDFKNEILSLDQQYIEEKIFVTGATYRILRMAARDKYHIYGLTDTEFYKRMVTRKEKYTKQQSQDLLKLFKEGLVKTKTKV